MDLRRVRTFVTVADLGTVSRAALHLRVAQPALSRQISELEQELGLKLFDRVGRRLKLTSDGEQLLGDCRGLLNVVSAVARPGAAPRRHRLTKRGGRPAEPRKHISGFSTPVREALSQRPGEAGGRGRPQIAGDARARRYPPRPGRCKRGSGRRPALREPVSRISRCASRRSSAATSCRGQYDRYWGSSVISVAFTKSRFHTTPVVRCRLSHGRSEAKHPVRKRRPTCLGRDGRSRTRRSRFPIDSSNWKS